jgi:ATP-dependent Clp protease ATP-binding subunit ClpC
MYERFTDRARNVMGLANQEAHRLKHQGIGAEHILLGLVADALDEVPSVATKAKSSVDAALERVFAPLARAADWLFDRLQHPALRGPLSPDFFRACDILKNLNVDPQAVRQEVEQVIQSESTIVGMANLPQTPRAKKTIEYAMGECRELGHNAVTTGHLLLGLLRVEFGMSPAEEGLAARALKNLGIKPEDVRNEAMRLAGDRLR